MSYIGQVALKIAGRDAGQIGVVVADLEQGYVEFSNALRSRKCNLSHLEFLHKKVSLKAGASQKDVVLALQKEGFAVSLPAKKTSKKTASSKPKSVRVVREKSKDVAPKTPVKAAKKKVA